MIKYAKVINEETGLCSVGTGTNTEFYKSIGMVELDVQQSDIDNAWYLAEKCPMKSDEEKAKAERERLNNLSMTRGDVFEALILAKGLGKAQIRTMIEKAELDDITKALYLNRFDEALEFYRGYPVFNLFGEQADITPEMWDEFFKTKDYKYLTTCILTINVTPETATVTGAGAYPYGSTVDVVVVCEGYIGQIKTVVLTEDVTLDVELEKEAIDKNTINTDKPDAQDELDTTIGESSETDTDNV